MPMLDRVSMIEPGSGRACDVMVKDVKVFKGKGYRLASDPPPQEKAPARRRPANAAATPKPDQKPQSDADAADAPADADAVTEPNQEPQDGESAAAETPKPKPTRRSRPAKKRKKAGGKS